MEYSPEKHVTVRGCRAADLVDWMKGRPKSFPPILFLWPAESQLTLQVLEVADAQWHRVDNSVEVLTSDGDLLTLDPEKALSLVASVS